MKIHIPLFGDRGSSTKNSREFAWPYFIAANAKIKMKGDKQVGKEWGMGQMEETAWKLIFMKYFIEVKFNIGVY